MLGFEKYSDRSHQITSIKKTKAVVVSFEGDSLKFFYIKDEEEGGNKFHVAEKGEKPNDKRTFLPFSFLCKKASIAVIVFSYISACISIGRTVVVLPKNTERIKEPKPSAL